MNVEPNNQEEIVRKRAALYVDGFNLYHPIREYGEPHLKWLDLMSLGNLIIPSVSETLVIVKYYSALRPDVGGSKDRHNAYLNALRSTGVVDVLGHYIGEPTECWDCGMYGEKPVEKQTDINMALGAYVDAQDDIYDHAYLLSADSDQAATFRIIKDRFPDKTLTTVSPPGRKPSSKNKKYADKAIELTRGHIEKCLFAGYVRGKTGIIPRPRDYDPPE